jgi:mRNA-degrading endonuclease toxin of MazEF toxin-antitoxin module
MYWTPRPKSGDIVQCRFPEHVGVPGPKERPALVLQVEEAAEDPRGSVVVVAYATSRRTGMLFPGEFVVEPGGKSGLAKLTKFDLVNQRVLPFDTEWFAPAPGRTPEHPRRGRLDLTNDLTKRRLQSAIGEAKRLRKRLS